MVPDVVSVIGSASEYGRSSNKAYMAKLKFGPACHETKLDVAERQHEVPPGEIRLS